MYPPHVGVSAKKEQVLISHKFSYVSNKTELIASSAALQVASDL